MFFGRRSAPRGRAAIVAATTASAPPNARLCSAESLVVEAREVVAIAIAAT